MPTSPTAPILADAQARYLLGSEFNPDDIGLRDYDNAVLRSSAVRFAYDYMRLNVARRFGALRHEDERAQEWLEQQVEPACRRALGPLLSAQYYGNVLADQIWEPVEGEAAIRLDEVKPALPDLWWSGQPQRDERRKVIGWKLSDGSTVPFANEAGQRQVVQWAPADERSAFGDPVARRVIGHYIGLVDCLKRELIGADAAAMPRIIFPRRDEEQGTEYTTSYFQLGQMGAMAIDEEHVQLVKELSAGFSGGSPFNDPIRRHQTGIFASFYEPPLIHAEAEFGTRAQAGTQLEAWIGTETALAEALRDDCLIPQVLLPGLRMQFGPRVPAPTWELTPERPVNRLEEAQIFQAAALTGFVDAAMEDQAEEFQERVGIPMGGMIEFMRRSGQTPAMAMGGETRP